MTADEDRPAIPWLALTAVVLWGASFVATRRALDAFSPFGLSALRFLLAGLILIGALLWRRGGLRPRAGDGGPMLGLALVLAVHVGIQAFGLGLTTASNTGWIIGFAPVAIAIGAQLLGQERLGLRAWLGVAIGAAGIALVIAVDPEGGLSSPGLGDILQIISCGTWAVYTLAARGVVQRAGALRVTALVTTLAGLPHAAMASVQGWTAGPLDLVAFGCIAFLAVFCSAIAFFLYFAELERSGPARAAVSFYIEPFVTWILAWLLLDEPLAWRVALGGVVVLFGVRLTLARAPVTKAGEEESA